MTLVPALAIAWVFAATAVALLPMRRQYLPGSILLFSAPVLIALIWVQFGWIAGLGAAFAFVSMFRRPIRYFALKWTGRLPEGGE